jgi:hypothetical protein
MADDFIGVPYPTWRDLDRRTSLHGSLLVVILALLILLVMTLVQKGVLSGWADLIRDVTPLV